MCNFLTLQNVIQIAGLAQIALAAGSTFVPAVLNWKQELAKPTLLIKQMFWTYAGYILVINLCFGLLSLFDPCSLLDHTNNAKYISGFISAYWLSRVAVQFFYFDRATFPKGKWHQLAEVILVTLFISLSIIYSMAFYTNFR